MRNCKKAYREALKSPKFRKSRGAVGTESDPRADLKKPAGGYRQELREDKKGRKAPK